MTDLNRLKQALIKADAAGNEADARVIAKAIRDIQAQDPQANQARIEGAFEDADRVNRLEAGQQDPISAKFVQGLTANFGDEIIGGIQAPIRALIDGQSIPEAYRQGRDEVRAAAKFAEQNHPGLAIGAEIGGALATGAGLARGGLLASSRLAPSVGLGARTVAAAKDSAALGAAFGVGGGEDLESRVKGGLTSSLTSAAIGTPLPAVGEVIRGSASAVASRVAPKVRAAFKPNQEAQRRVAAAIDIDNLPKIDDAVAARNGQVIINADRGGETVRALARSVANQNPAARDKLVQATSNRFETQNLRASNLIDRLVGGQADDLAFQDGIKQAARRANQPAYKRAYNSPKAQALWNEGYEQLMQSPAVQKAAKGATTRGANRAAVDGFTPIRNPFNFDDAGRFTIKEGVTPNLPFWDQVKRNLDSEIGKAVRSGDNSLAAELTPLKNRLVEMLDSSVPDYKAARQGAAAFFEAEDALDAGRKFVTQNKDIRGAIRNINKFSDAEKQAFRTGFAAELKEKIGQARDRTNVINQIFGTPNARNKIRAALGEKNAKEVESFVKIEAAQDMLRTAIQGNSTTVRQLAEMGLGAGVGGVGADGFNGGFSMTGALTGAVLARAARAGSTGVESRVMKRVADILLSESPKKLANGAKMIAKNKQMKLALDNYQRFIERLAITPISATAAN